MARPKKPRLPLFEGRVVETQKLKPSGTIDKDEWVCEAHDGGAVLYGVCMVRIDKVEHDFHDEGVCRVEKLIVADMVVEKPGGRLEAEYRDARKAEQDVRDKNSGQGTLDVDGDKPKDDKPKGDEVGQQRAKRRSKPKPAE